MVTGRPPSMVDPSSQRAFSLASHFLASSSEMVGRPSKTAGRSKGVRVAFYQMPERSGCRSAARGVAPALEAGAGAGALCAETVATARSETTPESIKRRNIMASPQLEII